MSYKKQEDALPVKTRKIGFDARLDQSSPVELGDDKVREGLLEILGCYRITTRDPQEMSQVYSFIEPFGLKRCTSI